jgi:hypothetical protein
VFWRWSSKSSLSIGTLAAPPLEQQSTTPQSSANGLKLFHADDDSMDAPKSGSKLGGKPVVEVVL